MFNYLHCKSLFDLLVYRISTNNCAPTQTKGNERRLAERNTREKRNKMPNKERPKKTCFDQ